MLVVLKQSLCLAHYKSLTGNEQFKMEGKEESYTVSFRCGYRIKVTATNMDDGIILAKASAIKQNHERPHLSTVTLSNGVIIYYCSVCGINAINHTAGEKECYNCSIK